MTQDFVQALPVHVAADITVVSGANLGDAISFADELDLDDVYELRPGGAAQHLTLAPGKGGALVVSPGSALGRVGHAVHLDTTLTMMTATGTTTELLIMVEVDRAGDVEAIYALPLSQLKPRTDYTLVCIDRSSARARFAEVACVSFARGTRVTMASGAQVFIEDLSVGDMVLTRDDGTRPLRWIGSNTVRAVGGFAPVRIRAGALNNENDLTVSPESRLFIYQRSDALGVGRAEVMVRARHLVNGDTITQQHGGFVEYFQLLFDNHQIIYAEGIATETMLVDPRTRTVLPPDLISALSQRPPGHARRMYTDLEVQQGLVRRPDVAAILRHASKR